MISRLGIAQRIFDYDPDTRPHGKLRLARDQLQAVQSKRRLIEHVLMKLSDDAVYECDCDDDMYIKRETHKITDKRVILERTWVFHHCVIFSDRFQSRWARLAGFDLGVDEPFRHRLGRHPTLGRAWQALPTRSALLLLLLWEGMPGLDPL